jgi:hypothetical protein
MTDTEIRGMTVRAVENDTTNEIDMAIPLHARDHGQGQDHRTTLLNGITKGMDAEAEVTDIIHIIEGMRGQGTILEITMTGTTTGGVAAVISSVDPAGETAIGIHIEAIRTGGNKVARLHLLDQLGVVQSPLDCARRLARPGR